MTSLLSRSVALLGAALALGACSSDTTTSPSSTTSVDLSTALQEVSYGDVNAIAGARAALGLPTDVTAPAATPSACTYTSANQNFVCPAASVGNLDFGLSYYLYDTAGTPQSQFVNGSTAAVRAVGSVSGTVMLPATNGTGGTATITEQSDLTLSGLLAATRSLSGNSSSHFDVMTNNATPVHVVTDMTTVASEVLFTADRADAPWPAGGTVTTDVHTLATRGSDPSISSTVHAVLTFDGTKTPLLVMTLGKVTLSCRIDLSGVAGAVC